MSDKKYVLMSFSLRGSLFWVLWGGGSALLFVGLCAGKYIAPLFE